MCGSMGEMHKFFRKNSLLRLVVRTGKKLVPGEALCYNKTTEKVCQAFEEIEKRRLQA